eukprot:298031_1
MINSNINDNNKCSSNTFNEAIILAILVSPPENGHVSATIVFIDNVNTLQLSTSTRLINLGKYESIEVNGFDNKRNKSYVVMQLELIPRIAYISKCTKANFNLQLIKHIIIIILD